MKTLTRLRNTIHLSGYTNSPVSSRNVIMADTLDRKQRLAQTPIQTSTNSLSSFLKRMSTPHLGTHSPVLLT